jgi:CubicO group peptidase (beta-lactamase class C family)
MKGEIKMKRSGFVFCLFALVVSFFLLSDSFVFSQESNKANQLEGLSSYVEKKMEEWKIPGMVIGVIQNDSVIFLKGFGFKDVEQKLPVTPQTLFEIASITKTFTAATVGILYDEGKLGWNEPIIDYIPDFRLYDEYATFHATMRDLLSHRTGLSPFSDLMYFVWPHEREEIYRRLWYLKPSLSFREGYQYSNLSFVIAGTIVGKLSGGTWEDFVEKRLFKPLGMTHSNFDLQIKNAYDFSYPYKYENGQYVKLPFRDRPSCSPAGGINSSASEMINWLKLHLNNGQFDNRQIISPASISVIKNPYIFMYYSEEKQWPPTEFAAMGWDFQFYSGYHLLSKGGIFDGFSGYISFMPQAKIGIIILANNRSALELTHYLTYYIYDQLLNIKEFSWDKLIEDERPTYEVSSEKSGKEPQAKSEKIPYPREKYIGSYEHDAYGKAVLSVENGEMQLNFNSNFVWSLEYCFQNVFKTEYDGATIKFEFNQDTAGNVISLEIVIEGTDFRVVFNKVTD